METTGATTKRPEKALVASSGPSSEGGARAVARSTNSAAVLSTGSHGDTANACSHLREFSGIRKYLVDVVVCCRGTYQHLEELSGRLIGTLRKLAEDLADLNET